MAAIQTVTNPMQAQMGVVLGSKTTPWTSTRVLRSPFPLCCISKGTEVVSIADDELMLKNNITYCNLPVSMGAGYELDRIPMKQISEYSTMSKGLICFKPKNDVSVIVRPTGKQLSRLLGPGTEDVDMFLTLMKNNSSAARGLAAPEPITKEFLFRYKCGMATKTMKLSPNGLVTFEDKLGCISTMRQVDAAFLQDLDYVRYTKAGLCQSILFGVANRIELSFLGDKYMLDMKMVAADLPAAHDAILAAMLGRAPSAPFHTWTGATGTMVLGPEFTTATMSKLKFLSLLTVDEVISFKTSHITHLRAALPSWQNALLRAIRDVELFQISRKCSALWGEDLVLLPVWPCTFFNDAYVSTLLLIKAIVSVTQFLIIFFCRKTAVIVGGPGPAKQVAFQPNEKPEELLREMAGVITQAQNTFSWEGAAIKGGHYAAGSSKESSVSMAGSV